jgi:hypothetical protein
MSINCARLSRPPRAAEVVSVRVVENRRRFECAFRDVAVRFARLTVAALLETNLVDQHRLERRIKRAGERRGLRDAVARVFFNAEWTTVFVMLPVKFC